MSKEWQIRMRSKCQGGVAHTSIDMPEIWSSTRLLFSMMSVKAPPSIYSITTQSSLLLTRYESRKLTILG